jgi:predicted small lipoprotein YifL
MRPLVLTLLLLMLSGMLGGCGKKGPLYLPDKPAASQSRE